jgi:hypothetical protein
MKMTRPDWIYLRWPLIALVTGLAIGAASVAFTHLSLEKSKKDHRVALAQRTEIQGKLARANQEQVELREKIGRYQELTSKGYFGAEQRLDWVEIISQIRKDRRLADLQYDLSAQHPVDRFLLPAGASAGNQQFLASTFRFNVSLVHEGDLMRVLEAFATRIPAYVVLKQCSLSRAADAGPRSLMTLRADCEQEWITVQATS